jgi:hypothetical protein
MFEKPQKIETVEGEDPYAEYADLIASYETPPVLPEDRLDCESSIVEFETMLAEFEAAHDLEALHAITHLSPEEAPNHLIREPAKKGLNPIVAKLNFLEEKTNITEARYDELRAKYKKLSRAVGMISRGIVDHER